MVVPTTTGGRWERAVHNLPPTVVRQKHIMQLYIITDEIKTKEVTFNHS